MLLKLDVWLQPGSCTILVEKIAVEANQTVQQEDAIAILDDTQLQTKKTTARDCN